MAPDRYFDTLYQSKRLEISYFFGIPCICIPYLSTEICLFKYSQPRSCVLLPSLTLRGIFLSTHNNPRISLQSLINLDLLGLDLILDLRCEVPGSSRPSRTCDCHLGSVKSVRSVSMDGDA